MAKRFSVASWNVEHFRGDTARVQRVVDFVNKQKPDVFGLYEVEGKTIFNTLVQTMPAYTFQITEGPETQEILVGVRKTITAFITQKIEFRAGTTHMRPGQLVTVVKNGTNYGTPDDRRRPHQSPYHESSARSRPGCRGKTDRHLLP